jgi:ribonuclease BN (tRNA processing enzyme)
MLRKSATFERIVATFTVTVLGSGGPFADRRRASSGYIVSVDATPRVIVDCGGGTFERIGRAHLDLSALELILLTHLHIDHTSDLPALIMHIYMSDRRSPIAVLGPAGRDGNNDAPENTSPQPGVIEFTRLLFGCAGAWRYMNTFTGFAINAVEAASDASEMATESLPPTLILRQQGISIEACAVPHGMMPSLAYRINYRGRSVVFSGDMSHSTTAFARMARNCSLLVQDFALPQRDVPHGNLHAKPSVVASVARESNAKALLLSHFMPAIEPELNAAVEIVRRDYHGRIAIAEDLSTYDIE